MDQPTNKVNTNAANGSQKLYNWRYGPFVSHPGPWYVVLTLGVENILEFKELEIAASSIHSVFSELHITSSSYTLGVFCVAF